MTELSDDCQIRINELISTFDQHDTLNIFGANWDNGDTGASGIVLNNPLFDPCNTCNNCSPINPLTQSSGCNSCGGSSVQQGSTGCGIIDWVQVLHNLVDCPLQGPFIAPKQVNMIQLIKPKTRGLSFSPIYVGPYEFNPSSDEEELLYQTLANYFTAYINVIENPSQEHKDEFNQVKMSLFELICKYLQQDEVTLRLEFPAIYDCGKQVEFQCWLNGIKSILCEKECGSKLCCAGSGSSCSDTGSCGSKQTCKCTYKCENVVLDMLIEMAGMFDLLISNPGTETTWDGVSGSTGYSGQFNGISIIIGSTEIVLPNIDTFLSIAGGLSGPTGITTPVQNAGSFNLGTLTYNFYTAYLQYIMCPCSSTAKANITATLIELKTMIEYYLTNPTILSNLLSHGYFLGTEFRAPNTGNMTEVQAAAWYGTFSQVLSTLNGTLGTCGNCSSCCECVECCDTKIMAGLNKLSNDMISTILAGEWYNGQTLITDTDQFLILGGSGPTITHTNGNCTIALTFNDVGQYIPCDVSITGETGDNGPTGISEPQIYLPDIVISVHDRMCNTTTTIMLGSISKPYYNAYIDLVTAICDSNYATKLLEYQEALGEMIDAVCLGDCPGLPCFYAAFGGTGPDSVFTDLNKLCCILQKCDKPCCCKPACISEFIFELINICEAGCTGCDIDDPINPCMSCKPCKPCNSHRSRSRGIRTVSKKQIKQAKHSKHRSNKNREVDDCGCDDSTSTSSSSCTSSSSSSSSSSCSTVNYTECETTPIECADICHDNALSVVDMILTRKPSKCIDPRLLMLYMYQDIVAPMQQQICCLQESLRRSNIEICHEKKDICEIQRCMRNINADISTINNELTAIECNITTINTGICNLNSEIKACCGNKHNKYDDCKPCKPPVVPTPCNPCTPVIYTNPCNPKPSDCGSNSGTNQYNTSYVARKSRTLQAQQQASHQSIKHVVEPNYGEDTSKRIEYLERTIYDLIKKRSD